MNLTKHKYNLFIIICRFRHQQQRRRSRQVQGQEETQEVLTAASSCLQIEVFHADSSINWRIGVTNWRYWIGWIFLRSICGRHGFKSWWTQIEHPDA